MSAIEFRALSPEDVEVRVGQCYEKGCSLLLYKDARCDMRLLDETIGPENWQCDYKTIDGKLFCGIGIRFKDGEWVWKWDTGTPSNMEAQKGEASDAFKRAAFKWGIGRELYTAPAVKVWADKCNVKKNDRTGKFQCYDDFRVVEMDVDGGQIVNLVVCNMSRRGEVVYGSAKRKPAQETQVGDAKRRMWEAIKKWAELHGRTPEDVLEGVKKRPEWADTEEFFESVAADFEADLP